MHDLPAAAVAAPPRALLPVVLSGTALVVLDFFLVNVLLPVIRHDLGAGDAAVAWTVAGYASTLAAGLVLGGRLGDRIGRRHAFVAGLLAFAVASAGCGLAPDAAALVGWRLVQGGAAALLLPQVLAIVSSVYTGPARARAFRTYALVVGLAGVVGQVLGGALVTLDPGGLGWRACFLVNVPVGVVAAVAALRTVPAGRAAEPRPLDVAGGVLLAASIAALILPLIEGRALGWPAWAWGCLAAVPVLLGGLVAVERRVSAPIVAPALLRRRTFTAGLLVVLAVYAGSSALFFVLALYLQDALRVEPLVAGLLFCPYGLAFMAGGAAGGAAERRWGRHGISAGALVRMGGLLGFAAVAGPVAGGAPLALLVVPLAVEGFGLGMIVGPLVSTVLLGVPAADAGGASGVLATAQQVGGALGVAAVGGAYLAGGGAPTVALLGLATLSALVAAVAQLFPRR